MLYLLFIPLIGGLSFYVAIIGVVGLILNQLRRKSESKRRWRKRLIILIGVTVVIFVVSDPLADYLYQHVSVTVLDHSNK